MGDIFGGAPMIPSQPPVSSGPGFVAYEDNNLKISFSFRRED